MMIFAIPMADPWIFTNVYLQIDQPFMYVNIPSSDESDVLVEGQKHAQRLQNIPGKPWIRHGT